MLSPVNRDEGVAQADDTEAQEDEANEPDLSQIHSRVVPWLQERLHIERLSAQSLAFLAEEISARSDLIQSPERLEESEQANMIDEMLRQIKRENRAAAQWVREARQQIERDLQNPASDSESARYDPAPALKRATDAVNRPSSPHQEQNGPGGKDSSKSSRFGAQGQQTDPHNVPGNLLVNLLNNEEKACAEAIGASMAAILGNLPAVVRFRNSVLRGRLLGTNEADEWIRSPEARFLSPEDFEQLGILRASARDQTAQILQWDSEDYDPFSEFDEDVSGPPSGEQNNDPSVALRGFSPGGFRPNWRYSIRLFLNHIGDFASEDRSAITPGAGSGVGAAAENQDRLRGMEVSRDMLTTQNGLPWIPFHPSDMKGPSDPQSTRGDTTFPRMFAGSAADALGQIGEQAGRSFPFESWTICWFVLTGEPPAFMPIRVSLWAPIRRMSKAHGATNSVSVAMRAATESAAKPAIKSRNPRSDGGGDATEISRQYALSLLTRSSAGRPLRSYVQINAEPWVSPETIAHYHRHYRQGLLPTSVRGDLRQPGGSGGGGVSIVSPVEHASFDNVKTHGKSDMKTHVNTQRQRTGRLPSIAVLACLTWSAKQHLRDLVSDHADHSDHAVTIEDGVSVRKTPASVPSRWSDLHQRYVVICKESSKKESVKAATGDYSSFVKSCKYTTAILDLPVQMSALAHLLRARIR